MQRKPLLGLLILPATLLILRQFPQAKPHKSVIRHAISTPSAFSSPFQQQIAKELARQARANIRYDDRYVPGGDPPANIGVCTDVILRAFRASGVPLQRLVNTDIRAHRSAYPQAIPDPNIDHRRCRNVLIFFRRQAISLPLSGPNADWQTGDVVFWNTRNAAGADHIGIIGVGSDSQANSIFIHHWPGQPVTEASGVYSWPVRGHFRWPATTSTVTKRHSDL